MTIKEFIKKWDEKEIENYGGVTSPSYESFQRDYKNTLKNMCVQLGWELHSFNPNHYCFSAVLKSPDNRFFYLSCSDIRYFPSEWKENVLYRTMKYDKDWHGGTNNFSDLESLSANLLKLDKWVKNREKNRGIER